ncbi:MAG: MFS transporter [Clostridia bacterium]|nr:MFS transporter [Clostridia bacterium]
MLSLLLVVIYLAFISLGLPDSLLGAAWPTLYRALNVPVSWSGMVFLIIAAGTVVSSLLSDRMTRWLGAGRVTLFSVATTAVALFGFSFSHSFIELCIWAIPYGLGAGSVDAALNNYVALHYASRHMSWLHCMWGVGASLGPYIMSAALTNGLSWNVGYRRVGMIQTALVAVLIVSLPLWKKVQNGINEATSEAAGRPLSLKEIFALPGAKHGMLCFFCYCALEQTTGLWTSSYLALVKGMDAAVAARYASLFFLGITAGRAISGFISMKLNDEQMVRLGQGLVFAGILLMLLPIGDQASLVALIIIGLGSAPIYP